MYRPHDGEGCPGALLATDRDISWGGSGAGDLATESWPTQEARRLYEAERRGVPDKLVSRRRTGLTLDDAYRIQRCGTALRIRDGASVVGYKVGLTSTAMQRQFGIDEPDSGILLDSMLVPPGETLAVADLLSPRIEAEIAFRVGTNLSGTNVAERAAHQAMAEVLLALEVIDSRFGFEGLTLVDSVADNGACARVVLGDAMPMPCCDLRAERLTVQRGPALVAVGEGRDVLGDPIRSVVWLARHLAAFDTGLQAGDVVLAGAVHASIPLHSGDTVSVSSTHLSPVSLAAA